MGGAILCAAVPVMSQTSSACVAIVCHEPTFLKLFIGKEQTNNAASRSKSEAKKYFFRIKYS